MSEQEYCRPYHRLVLVEWGVHTCVRTSFYYTFSIFSIVGIVSSLFSITIDGYFLYERISFWGWIFDWLRIFNMVLFGFYSHFFKTSKLLEKKSFEMINFSNEFYFKVRCNNNNNKKIVCTRTTEAGMEKMRKTSNQWIIRDH